MNNLNKTNTSSQFEMAHINYVSNFLSKLIHETQNRHINWYKLDLEGIEFVYPEEDSEEFCVSLLLKENVVDRCYKYYVNSKTFGEHTCLSGACFSYELENGSNLVLLNVSDNRQRDQLPVIEAWLTKEGYKSQCLGTSTDEIFYKAVSNLYSSIINYSEHENLLDCYKNDIDAFMNAIY